MGEPHPDMIGRPGVGFVGLWILGSRYRIRVWTGEVGVVTDVGEDGFNLGSNIRCVIRFDLFVISHIT